MPTLTILAGPNGAGKTRLSNYLFDNKIISTYPLNLDLLREEAINELPYSVYGADVEISRITDRLFKKYCEEAILREADFCYECNFRIDQVKYVKLFEEKHYEINLVYIFLKDVEQSKRRVEFRVKKEKGNIVSIESITENFNQGLRNLDNHFNDFDNVTLIDNISDSYNEEEFNMSIALKITHQKLSHVNDNFPPQELKPYFDKISRYLIG